MTQPRDRSEQEAEAASQAIFARVRTAELSPGPFLKARVLANQAERQKRRRGVVLWRGLALGAMALAIAFASSTILFRTRYEAVVNQTVAIRVDSSGLGDAASRVAFVRVELPGGVRFQSQAFPEIAEKDSLTLAWKPGQAIGRVPILVRASEDGEKVVRVSFLDGENHVLSLDRIRIRFRKGT